MYMYFRICLFLAVASLTLSAAKRSYDGYQVLRVSTDGLDQPQLIRNFEKDGDADVWAEGLGFFDIMVSPQKLVEVRTKLANYKAKFTVLHSNVQEDIEREEHQLIRSRANPSPLLDYNIYNTYTDIMAELDLAAARCPTAQGVSCETFVAGLSYEGREMKGLRIFRTDTTQRAIWIDATIHAREWLATATHLKILSHLVDDYTTDAQVQALVDKYQFYLLPVVNPDGYEFTWTDDRLWRKNRSPNAGSICFGTDLNRNFDQLWGNAGTSDQPCSETYGGTSPASEVEVQAEQSTLNSLGPNLVTSIHLHTYAQYWLIPWGSVDILGNCDLADDHAELMAAANAAADATENTHNTVWERGNWCQVLYPSSGTAQDYAKATSGIKYTFTAELRGNSFVAAPDQIQPSFEEVWNGVTALIATVDP